MVADNYTRQGFVTNVVDGDTIDVMVDLGYHVAVEERFRLLRINCPEVYGTEKEEGLKSKAFTTEKLLNQKVMLVSTKTDSFKRWLAEVYYTNENGEQVNISDQLLAEGLAVPYTK